MDLFGSYTEPDTQRGLGLQLLIAVLIGLCSFMSFSVWRKRWPQVYSARKLRTANLPDIDNDRYGWVGGLLKVTDREVLQFAGLDAYVFLMLFRAAIALFWRLLLVSIFFVGSLQLWYRGSMGDPFTDDPSPFALNAKPPKDEPKLPNVFGQPFWVFVAATYIFTIVSIYTMRRFTAEVIGVRQAHLGHQNTITDRTLRISGIPRALRSQEALTKYLTILLGTEPESIVLCRRWERIDKLWSDRKKLVIYLERLWAEYLGPKNPLIRAGIDSLRPASPSELPRYQDDAESELDSSSELISGSAASAWRSESATLDARISRALKDRPRPMGRTKWFGLSGSRVDLIDYYTVKLATIDDKIVTEREVADERPVTSMAFVTMKTVADCQLAAQALFSPAPHKMVRNLAPGPNDVLWRNVYIKPRQRSMQTYLISFIVLVCSAFLVVPLSYISKLLDTSSISRLSPALGDWLESHPWLSAFTTEVLPTFVFSSFNLVVPYFYAYLSSHQSFVSKSDVELSTAAKNFFYVFVNLFLIFTVGSTVFTAKLDTTKLAEDFGNWLKTLSAFYTNLIVLQGIGLTPLRLLQAGSVFQIPFLAVHCRSARDFHDLYKPPRINYGIILPIPLFIFIVVLTYSLLRRRILVFGLVYFVIGYVIYKYQVLYAMVHPQHSTGRLWVLIMRRVYLGIGMFHLGMIGLLLGQQKYGHAALILPLPLVLLGFWYDFETFVTPLFEYVSVEALHQHEINDTGLATFDQYSEIHGDDCDEVDGDVRAARISPRTQSSFLANDSVADPSYLEESDSAARLWSPTEIDMTLDENREKNLEYVNKSLVAPLEGPWIGVDGDECIVASPSGFQKRSISYVEWV